MLALLTKMLAAYLAWKKLARRLVWLAETGFITKEGFKAWDAL